jgi:hypothetical protein
VTTATKTIKKRKETSFLLQEKHFEFRQNSRFSTTDRFQWRKCHVPEAHAHTGNYFGAASTHDD